MAIVALEKPRPELIRSLREGLILRGSLGMARRLMREAQAGTGHVNFEQPEDVASVRVFEDELASPGPGVIPLDVIQAALGGSDRQPATGVFLDRLRAGRFGETQQPLVDQPLISGLQSDGSQ